MKIVIFAGGAGTRLWPLSRKKSPKQFEKIIGDKSTLQLAVDRLKPDFSVNDVYIATNVYYKKIIYEQLPEVPKENFFFEPEKRDVGPAIALVMGILNKTFPDEPVIILWSDHLVKEAVLFRKIIKNASQLIKKDHNKIIFIGHKPRFASTNLGYIHFGKKMFSLNKINFYQFLGFKYKPDLRTAKKFFKSENYAWNLGYFVTTPAFLYKQYEKLAPNIYKKIEAIIQFYNKKSFNLILKNNYSQIESISFDQAILEKINKKDALVIVEDIGWSDVGAWEALKESLESHQYENVIRGRVHLDNVRDSLVYNYENKKLIVGLDLDEMIIVNTNDVLLVAKKNSITKLSQLIKSFKGTENECLT